MLPPDERTPTEPAGLTLVARVVHISDSHLVDALSPARFAGAHTFHESAWRAWEGCSTQLLDGVIRAANRIHASGTSIDLILHTGDACDNAQSNELGWFVSVMDGRPVDPLSGPDDRPPDARPDVTLDPYASFQPQGLYRNGVHGDRPSIPWYVVPGNHDCHAIGIFPFVTAPDGRRIAPLPLSIRPGILLPAVFDPTGSWAHGSVTPANPGPPSLLGLPMYVAPNAGRAYFSKREFVRALFSTSTEPAGHGFADAEDGPTWYSVSPAPGLRLIGLDTNDLPFACPEFPYSEGCVAEAQRDFLRGELEAAQARGELIVVASHHPSYALVPSYGSALGPDDLRELLNAFPGVVLHLAGHSHANRVAIRGGYLEIETCSTLDPPQEGRVIEVWRDIADGSVEIGYRMFSHDDDIGPPWGEDPLRALRTWARAVAEKGEVSRKPLLSADEAPRGTPPDREGRVRLPR